MNLPTSLSTLFPKWSIVSYDPGYVDENGNPVQEQEIGVVSSCSWDNKHVFVKFKRELDRFDNDWGAVTAKGCNPKTLTIIQRGELHEDMAQKQEG